MKTISGGLTAQQIAEYVGRSDPVLIEAGCNNGDHSKQFLDQFPGCRLYCFEPDPRPIAKFRAKIGNDPRCTLIEKAVSDTDGTTMMYRSSGKPPNQPNHNGDWDMSGSLLKPTGHLKYSPWVTFPESHRLEVETIRLDTWTRRSGLADCPIDFIWSDLQGGEGAMIRGGQETLQRTRYLYCEIPFFSPGYRFHNTPLYAGQATLPELQAMLPDWETVALYDTDNALFGNKNFN